MLRKKIWAGFLLLMVAVLFCSCLGSGMQIYGASSQDAESEMSKAEGSSIISGTSSSEAGGGASEPDSSAMESSEAASGKATEKALDISTICLDADDERIYYISDGDESIYSVKKDGSAPQKLCDDEVSWLRITEDGKIKYATNMKEGLRSNSYTMNKDGSGHVSNNELLLDKFDTIERTGKDGKVYYNLAEAEEGNAKPGIYVKNKGAHNSKGTLVFEGIINSFFLLDDYLVVSATCSLEGNFIYRAKLDGSGVTKVFAFEAYSLAVSGDIVYFVNKGDGRLIYKTTGDAIRNAS